MRRTWWTLLVGMWCATAGAYEVGSGVTHGCHEYLTEQAVRGSGLLDVPPGRLPDDATWEDAASLLVSDAAQAGLSQWQRFALFSLVLGSRAPDTEGFSSFSLPHLRRLHGSTHWSDQYIHFTRASRDDYLAGDEAVVQGSRTLIAAGIAEAVAQWTSGDVLGTARMTLDFYGAVDVPVWMPGYLLGVALHTVQDAFSHTIRNGNDGLHTIVAVANYIDAIGPSYDARRDGIAHSYFTDDCTRPENEEVVTAAIDASMDFLQAALAAYQGADTAVEVALDTWMRLAPRDCRYDWSRCDAERLADLTRRDPSVPYLGCTAAPGPPTAPWWVLVWTALAALCVWIRTRGSSGSPRPATASLRAATSRRSCRFPWTRGQTRDPRRSCRP